uniref:Phosphoacetylglucosamine mutase n=1 Tax=Meloidogyne enterolobii TaxID=390850 RepID=A0A6V7U3C0_MELEN|nr:unnamed protein product [Meloidogyne enterolobii]
MTSRPLIYGTSGFRAKADEQLQLIVYRAAFYAAVRAKKLGKAVGMMITASHNPGCDNGLKLVDPSGRMLAMECEEELTKIANGTEEEFEKFKNEEIQQIKNNEEKDNPTPIIVIATDTRPSSAILYEEAVKGIKLLGISVDIKYFEHHTTPQLHYIVRAINEKKPVDDYIQQFRRALEKSREFLNFEENTNLSPLYLDCANGVGSLWIAKYLENNGFICKNGLDVTKEGEVENLDKNIILVNLFNINTNDGELLNNGCGADFVKIKTSLPANFPTNLPVGTRCASFDGDADRLIYFYPNLEGKICLLDGDHICAIFTKFINEQLNEAKTNGELINLNFGVVQTAYANGNSTRYFSEKLNIKPLVTKTGTKHLEEAALNYDIGIYFEANGHGTVYFSDKFYKLIKEGENGKEKEQVPRYIKLLSLFSKLVNEVDGDAIADLLTVEFLLRYFNWTIQDWEKNTYSNCPSFQLKVPVSNRNLFVTPEDNETKLLQPIGIQNKIDECVSKFLNARAFIRPSGTEQIVRIYSEANSLEEAKQLANELEKIVKAETLKE